MSAHFRAQTRSASVTTRPMSNALTFAVTAAMLDADPRAAARTARSMGFSGLLFDAFGASIDLTELSLTGRREFRHVLSSADQQLAGLQVELGPKGFGPGADIDRTLSQFERVFEAARDLAA